MATSGGGQATVVLINRHFVQTNYYELYRMKTDRHFLDQKLVTHARDHGIKAGARAFGCSRNTVRK